MNRMQALLFGAALAPAALVVACAGGGDASSTMLSMDPSAGVPIAGIDLRNRFVA